MTTHFITAEVDLKENPLKFKKDVEARLNEEGEPLRWAVTEVDKETQKAHVEAIVTKELVYIFFWGIVVLCPSFFVYFPFYQNALQKTLLCGVNCTDGSGGFCGWLCGGCFTCG